MVLRVHGPDWTMSAIGSIDDVLTSCIQRARVGTLTSRHGRHIGDQTMAATATAARTRTINIRIEEERRTLIDRAAEAAGKDRTQFVLDAATREATTVLLDQRYFQLDTAAFAKFNAALDASPAENPRLRELLSRKAPWER